MLMLNAELAHAQHPTILLTARVNHRHPETSSKRWRESISQRAAHETDGATSSAGAS